ncbi:hypothetical protein BC835DRAFT_1414217 [Cytidiella melzeri]|nr:hypothetical protein BC835DRAFT_1414217 [Cytidiella melzeri]
MPSAMETRRSKSRQGKRRRSEVDVDGADVPRELPLPSAKRRRGSLQSDTEGGIDEAKVPTRTGEHNRRAIGDRSNTPDARDKKRRKKKKKKVSVVQQNDSLEKPASSTHAHDSSASPTLASKNSSSTQKQATPGPSRLSRSGSHTAKSDQGEARSVSPNSTVAVHSAPSAKGKERATSANVSSAPSSATKMDKTLVAELESHRTLAKSLFPSLICHICLYLMHRPFALTPCGHVSCFSCLVNWFTTEPVGQPQDQPDQVVIYADPPAQIAAPAVNGEANEVEVAPAPAPPPLPFPRRKKTCPQCRAVVRTKPVEVWPIKDMVSQVVRSGLADLDSIPVELRDGAPPGPSAPAPNVDPWKSIFPAANANGNMAGQYMAASLGLRDDEDGGVYRCLDCMHEIVDGACSDCGRVYHGHRQNFDFDWEGDSEEDDMDDDLGFMMGSHPNLRYLDDNEDTDESNGDDYDPLAYIASINWPQDELEDPVWSFRAEGSEESYEGSFIDDDDAGEGRRNGDDGEGPDDDEDHGRVMRRPVRTGRRTDPYILSDDEDEEEDIRVSRSRAPSRRNSRHHHTISEVSEDEDVLDDDGLAAAVAERERYMYGDDGSLPLRNHDRSLSEEEEDVVCVTDDEEQLDEDSTDEDNY